MKKIVSLLALVGLISVIITGCGSTSSKKSETVGTVSTDGSTSMEKVIGYLSEAYMVQAAVFRQLVRADVTLDFQAVI